MAEGFTVTSVNQVQEIGPANRLTDFVEVTFELDNDAGSGSVRVPLDANWEAAAEAAVVARPDEMKGQALAAFVTLQVGKQPSEELRKELREHVAKEIGAIAKPDDIRFTEALPKTRSGKIMRRLLRDIAAGKESVGDTTTLEDYSVLARLREENE